MKSFKKFLKEEVQASQLSREETLKAKQYLEKFGFGEIMEKTTEPIEIQKLNKFIHHVGLLLKKGEEINLRELYKRHF